VTARTAYVASAGGGAGAVGARENALVLSALATAKLAGAPAALGTNLDKLANYVARGGDALGVDAVHAGLALADYDAASQSAAEAAVAFSLSLCSRPQPLFSALLTSGAPPPPPFTLSLDALRMPPPPPPPLPPLPPPTPTPTAEACALAFCTMDICPDGMGRRPVGHDCCSCLPAGGAGGALPPPSPSMPPPSPPPPPPPVAARPPPSPATPFASSSSAAALPPPPAPAPPLLFVAHGTGEVAVALEPG